MNSLPGKIIEFIGVKGDFSYLMLPFSQLLSKFTSLYFL